MAAFPIQYQDFLESVGIGHMISDFQDKKSQYNVMDRLDDQVIEFAPENGVVISSASCAEIKTHAINLRHPISSTHDAGNALLHLYGSNMKPLGWQENMNLMMTKKKQVAEALYVPPVADCEASLHDINSGDPVNHQTIIDKKNCTGIPSAFRVMADHFSPDSNTEVLSDKGYAAYGKMKKKRSVQCVRESDIETYGQVSCQKQSLKKSKMLIYKSSLWSNCSKDHEENSNPKCDMPRVETAKLLPTIVQVEAKAESKKNCIYVRARRGQATDSHSLAERARREEIRKRIKILQNLVPGCNMITGEARVLEEIINYIMYLQKEVEILSLMLDTGVPHDCHWCSSWRF